MVVDIARVHHARVRVMLLFQIFQLLLPECAEDSNGPLILLVVLCAIAPFWAWGSSLMSTKDPERKNAAAR